MFDGEIPTDGNDRKVCGQFLSRQFRPQSLRSFFKMDFVLLGPGKVKCINAIAVWFFFHSFLWEKGVWSEDEKFDITRDFQAPVILKVDCGIQWINLLLSL